MMKMTVMKIPMKINVLEQYNIVSREMEMGMVFMIETEP